MSLRASLGLAVLVLAGCRSGGIADPNDPKDGPVGAATMNGQMQSLNDHLWKRRQKGELTEEAYLAFLRRGASEILADVKLDAVDTSEMWLYAEVLRTAKDWPRAEQVLKLAVKHAKLTKNDDRFVNDSLRLAQAQAQLGKVSEAIASARSTFKVRPEEGAPVMMATLYEIVPAAQGKGKDLDLAKLLRDAIEVHRRVKVDSNTPAGQAFVQTRPRHIAKAWETVQELYTAAGRSDLAARVYEDARPATRL